MKPIFPTMFLLLVLTACGGYAPATLDGKLADATTPAERKHVLHLACLNEAEWPLHNRMTANSSINRYRKNLYHAEVSRMKTLCRQMDDLTSADVKSRWSPDVLSASCRAEVRIKRAGIREGGAGHADRVEAICKKMIPVSPEL